MRKIRTAALLLAAAMALTLLPGAVRAEEAQPYRLYFGQLHGHTADSDGMGTPAEAYAYAAQTAGLDFLAITDHSNSFDGAEDGALWEDAGGVSAVWRQGREAAEAATTDSFLALYGFEMTWQNGLGHISTFFTPGFQSRKQPEYGNYSTALEAYYQTLAAVPAGISQFNHPGTFYGDFEDFGHYSQAADNAMQLLEVVSEGVANYDAYTRALDKGWHVAPTNNQNNHNGCWGDADSGRTVVYAAGLTEEAFSEALRSRRVYATEDADLEILYFLEGNPLGTVLHRQSLGDVVTLTASLADPTDGAVGTVEVIVDGGAVAAVREVTEPLAQVQFQLPSDYGYYYLRITQSDGDVAVTAPVWVDQTELAEITAFTCDTALAVQDRPIGLRVEVQNRADAEFLVEQVTFSLDGQALGTVADPAAIPGNSTAAYTAQLSWDGAGAACIRAEISGTIGGEAICCTAELELTFLTEDLVTTLVVDGSHGTLPEMTELEALAAQHCVVVAQAQELTANVLASCDCLLIPAPERDFEESYVNLLADFLASGRTVILCGQGDAYAPDSADRLNALAEALGLTGRFRDDLAMDPVNNGGQVDELVTGVYNEASDFCAGLTQPWSQTGGCTVDPGQGTWLVKGMATTFSIDGDSDGAGISQETYTQVVEGYDVVSSLVVSRGEAVLLSREETAYGGWVFFSGGLFAEDAVLDPGGRNLWDEPNGNALVTQAILGIHRKTLEAVTITQARAAEDGELVRVQAYVTAGTAVSHNSFPNMIYVQDETGGLGVLDFKAPDVGVGMPVELYLRREEDGFHLLHWQALDGLYYNFQPAAPGCQAAVQDDTYLEQLVQVEGQVESVTLTEDGKGLSSLTLRDREGNTVTVRIEDQIASAATGENTLAESVAEGDWVSAIGIVYQIDGQRVLRVRNCEEVTAIRETGKVYRVVQGEYTLWNRKDGKSIYIEVEGPGEEFLGIEVNGETLNQSHYQTTVTEDGTLLFRIWPRYLKTLGPGSYSLVFRFRDGSAEAVLDVVVPADIPETGDPLAGYLFLMILSGAALGVKRRRLPYMR